MTDDLATLTTPRLVAPDRFEATIPEGWLQGRGVFGGIVFGTLIRALEASEPERDRSMRSLTAEICGPVAPGPAEIAVEVLRRGSGVSTIAARLTQGGAVLAHAVGVLGRARGDRPRRSFLAPPELPPWRDLAVFVHKVMPQFGQHVEFRSTGPLPYTGGSDPVAAGWIRAKNPGSARDRAYVAALVDAWWPAIFALETSPRPIGTIAFSIQFVESAEGLPPDAPLFHRARMLAEHEGYTVEYRELWGEDGRLLALNEQTIAVIR